MEPDIVRANGDPGISGARWSLFGSCSHVLDRYILVGAKDSSPFGDRSPLVLLGPQVVARRQQGILTKRRYNLQS